MLARNRTLHSLNLSCNNIIDKADQNNPFDFNFISAMQDYVQRREDAIKAGLGVIAQKKVEDTHPMQVVYHFG